MMIQVSFATETKCLWNYHFMVAGKETNYTEESPPWEGNMRSNGQEISSLLTLLLW
jgi:hypothetical protein